MTRLTRAELRRMAKWMEEQVQILEDSMWEPKLGRVTPASTRKEIERVRRWVAKLRAP